MQQVGQCIAVLLGSMGWLTVLGLVPLQPGDPQVLCTSLWATIHLKMVRLVVSYSQLITMPTVQTKVGHPGQDQAVLLPEYLGLPLSSSCLDSASRLCLPVAVRGAGSPTRPFTSEPPPLSTTLPSPKRTSNSSSSLLMLPFLISYDAPFSPP